MAIVIKPAFQSTIADDPADLAAGYLTPSRWNAAMSITGLTANALLLSDGTDLTQSENLTFDGTKLTIANGTATGLVLGVGAVATPSINFGTTNTGFYRDATLTNYISWAAVGTASGKLGQAHLGMVGNGTITWGNKVNTWVSSTDDTGLKRQAAAVVRITDSGSGGGSLEFLELTAPAGLANTARVFAQDNGAGKTQLMVIFGSGAAQQLAIEV